MARRKASTKSAKKWLEENKIFFELISMLLISFMAVIVSIKANTIAEDQKEIMVRENLPNIDILSYQAIDDSSGCPTTFWRIYNRGGVLSDLQIEDISFIRANWVTDKSYSEKLVPIYDYLDFRHEITGETNGLMYILNDRSNKLEKLRLEKEFVRQGYAETETYLKISFKNFKNQKQVVYYTLNSEREINKRSWDMIAKIQSEKKLHDLRALTLKRIKQM